MRLSLGRGTKAAKRYMNSSGITGASDHRNFGLIINPEVVKSVDKLGVDDGADAVFYLDTVEGNNGHWLLLIVVDLCCISYAKPL